MSAQTVVGSPTSGRSSQGPDPVVPARTRGAGWSRTGYGLLGILLALGLWELLAYWKSDPVILPTVQDTANTYWTYLGQQYPAATGKTLWQHALVSALRILGGWGAGVLIGVLVGGTMASFALVRHVIDPLIEITRPLPPLAFIPLFIVWFGIGETSKFLLILVGVVPIMIIATVSALEAVPLELEQAARSLGAGALWTLLTVRLRAALPSIITGMRLSMGAAWTSIVAVELIAATSGLGYLINNAGVNLQTSLVLSGIVTISILGIAFDSLLRLLQRGVDPLAPLTTIHPLTEQEHHMTTHTTDRPLLDLDRLGPAFGAIVSGIDLRQLSDEQVIGIRSALVENKVLFFRGQELTDHAQVQLGRRLGEVTAGHPVATSETAQHAEIFDIDSTDPEFSFSDVWHTDVTFMEKPPLGSILRAVTLPASGGDTSWVDTQLAYQSLSAPVRELVDQLSAVHDGNREWGAYLRRRQGMGNVWDGKQVTELVPVQHPVVRVHPESGRRGLFVNPGFTSHVVGVSEAESRAILDLLYAHLTKPEHTIRHRWQRGDVGIWDNRSTCHYANRDYSGPRIMRRITLAGDRPSGVGESRPDDA